MRATTTVVLNLGMGVESSALLVRWLREPETRWFPLRKLLVLTAQVGSESRRTRWLIEHVLYPLLREHRVRTVQVARGGPSDKDGIVVLADSREPTACRTDGHHRLQDELLTAGTVPQYASGQRRCSIKFKGAVLDRWLAGALGRRRFTQVMGFSAEELERVARDRGYATVQRATSYPLVEWGWGRQQCEDYLLETTGERWVKNCCAACPFTGGREHLLARFRDDPAEAAEALLIEFVSVALNPRMTRFPRGRSLYDAVARDGNALALARFAADLEARPWTLYEVRRVFYAAAVADRKVAALATGDRAAMTQALIDHAAAAGAPVEQDGQHQRATLRRRIGPAYPQVEHTLVLAPATVADKSRKRFDAAWARATAPYYQQVLL